MTLQFWNPEMMGHWATVFIWHVICMLGKSSRKSIFFSSSFPFLAKVNNMVSGTA